jgi:type VI secretion system protein ImpA
MERVMSGRWEASELLQPVTAEQPCGQDLEDSALLASFDRFRLFGNSTPLDPAPEWNEIKQHSIEALGTSKDLRLLAHLGTALLRTDGLAAFNETLKVAAHWLDAYWADTYPRVDEDAIVRRSALNCFSDQIAVIDGLRRSPLVNDRRIGRFSLRDVEIATGLIPPAADEPRADEAQINAAFSAMPLDDLKAVSRSTTEALAALKSIDARMRSDAGTEAAPSFEVLNGQLSKIDRLLRTQLAARPDAEPVDDDAGMTEARRPAGAPVGAITSRQDAVRALEAVAEYFRQAEPSSPLPLLLDRAKRLIAKNFLEVLADIAPAALEQARSAGGLKNSE